MAAAGPAITVAAAAPSSLRLRYPSAGSTTTEQCLESGAMTFVQHTRERLVIEVHRWTQSQDVILTLPRLMRLYGKPQLLRSDHGAEFTAAAVMRWLQDQNVGPVFIAPGSPWQDGYVESFNGKLRDERLNRECFRDIYEVRDLIEQWRHFYNHRRPHSAPGYQTPNQTRQRRLNQDRINIGLTAWWSQNRATGQHYDLSRTHFGVGKLRIHLTRRRASSRVTRLPFCTMGTVPQLPPPPKTILFASTSTNASLFVFIE